MMQVMRAVSATALAGALAFGPVWTAAAETTTQPEAKTAAEAASQSDAVAGTPADDKPVEERITEFTLDNGLQVVVLPDHRAPVVTQMVYYHVGAADEAPGESGIAHFLEHLMFKGTKANPEGAFSKAVADIGGQENAFTTDDYTGYYQQVPASELEMVMSFEADRMANLVLTDEVVAPERDVILEERRMRVDNDPGAQLQEAVGAALFQNSPYGIPVIGWRGEMEQLSRDDAIAFYDKYYTPNNATLLVAGDVTVDEVRRLAEETYGKVERRADPGDRERALEPEPLAARTVTLSDPKVTQPSMQRVYLVPSETTAEPGEAEALDVLSDILGGGTTSRLYRSLVVDKAIAAGTGAYYGGTALKEGQFGVYGMPRGDATLADIEAAIDAEIAKIRETGVTEAELERAKNRVRKNMIYLRDSQTAMARRVGAALSTGRTLKDVETWPDRIEAVTVEAVNAAARKYLEPQRSVTGYLTPKAPAAASAAPDAAGDAAEDGGADAATPAAAPSRS
ncbi:pitrilysin family protein [Aurantimonas sp. 22II-16-19i]|uniref:M16 family metallopeptidase n=1 Tax=Aurantimonas sp. 22II-16-19i TaxID=1317114 RepID=UPI0009F7FDAE|nr:pitrilysin family protein [Aurantimonas sp. 22II-16-19i]ORE94915.1 putative Zn-dependent peptidase [Aurantimonas sp. 22II-16-19i]